MFCDKMERGTAIQPRSQSGNMELLSSFGNLHFMESGERKEGKRPLYCRRLRVPNFWIRSILNIQLGLS